MNHSDLLTISNARNRISSIRDLNALFLATVQQSSPPNDLPTTLTVSGSNLESNCYGYAAKAEARVVKAGATDYAIEYVFNVVDGEFRTVEICRIYLLDGGFIVESLVAKNAQPLCDIHNQYIQKIICGRLLIGIVGSTFFDPT